MSDLRLLKRSLKIILSPILILLGMGLHISMTMTETLCLIRDEVIEFIKTTQPEEWVVE